MNSPDSLIPLDLLQFADSVLWRLEMPGLLWSWARMKENKKAQARILIFGVLLEMLKPVTGVTFQRVPHQI